MKTRITANNLPPRARQLDPSETVKVFGGCTGYDYSCDPSKPACCSGLTCRSNTYVNQWGSNTLSAVNAMYFCWH